jgi:hypothetical protein
MWGFSIGRYWSVLNALLGESGAWEKVVHLCGCRGRRGYAVGILARDVPLTAFQVENIFLIPGPTDTGGRLRQHLERQRCEVGSSVHDLVVSG